MTTECFNLTCLGGRHKKENIPCQDYSLSMLDGKLSLAVVCDGHGAPMYFRSDTGARFAAEAVKECVCRYVNDQFMAALKGKPFKAYGPMRGKDVSNITDEAYLILCTLILKILEYWDEKVKQHAENHPMTEQEAAATPEPLVKAFRSGKNVNFAYGTTLLAHVQMDGCWFAFQIGDGKMIYIDDDTAFFPIVDDEQCHDNITTSVCDNDAMDDVRVSYEGDGHVPESLFLCTDGLEKVFVSEEKLAEHCSAVQNVLKLGSKKILVDNLSKVYPKLSTVTSGDDISLAGIYHKDIK